MYRIKKCKGWNKYRVQFRLFFIWFNADRVIYTSKAQAELLIEFLTAECEV